MNRPRITLAGPCARGISTRVAAADASADVGVPTAHRRVEAP